MVRDSFLTGLGTGTFNNSHVIFFFFVCVCANILVPRTVWCSEPLGGNLQVRCDSGVWDFNRHQALLRTV